MSLTVVMGLSRVPSEPASCHVEQQLKINPIMRKHLDGGRAECQFVTWHVVAHGCAETTALTHDTWCEWSRGPETRWLRPPQVHVTLPNAMGNRAKTHEMTLKPR